MRKMKEALSLAIGVLAEIQNNAIQKQHHWVDAVSHQDFSMSCFCQGHMVNYKAQQLSTEVIFSQQRQVDEKGSGHL